MNKSRAKHLSALIRKIEILNDKIEDTPLRHAISEKLVALRMDILGKKARPAVEEVRYQTNPFKVDQQTTNNN